jgi:hypothetical protein
MNTDPTSTAVLDKVANEPVAIAGAVRALVYGLLATTGLDPSILALIVVVAEALVSSVLRRLVSPVGRVRVEHTTQRPAVADAARDEATTAIAG